MAYAVTGATAAGAAWLTDRPGTLTFTGDYRAHLHLEGSPPSPAGDGAAAPPPLYRHQRALPRLPVTPLRESAACYLQSVRALATPAEFRHTQAAVAAFLAPGGRGELLQRRLEARAEAYADSSWLQEWWNRGSYLDYREPVVVFVSYFFHFADLPMGLRGDQVARAAGLLHGALTFRQKVCLQEDLGLGAVCHTAFKYMFNSCRVPVDGRDKSVVYPPADDNNNHVVVIRGRQFFSFRATQGKRERWAPLSPGELAGQLRRVIDAADRGGGGAAGGTVPPVGALTGGHRDTWAAARAQLVADGNQRFLDAVQSSVLVVCLDAGSPTTPSDVGRALWHGDSRDRWFDKTLQLIVFGNGKAGMQGEHSQFDGQPMVACADFVLKHERALVAQHGVAWAAPARSERAARAGQPQPRALSATLLRWSPQSAWNLRNVVAEFADLVGRHDLATCAFRAGGKRMIKGFKMSPDAFAQMAIQLAYFRKFGCLRATYEPFSMRAYRHGRTETVRVVSVEAQAFCAAMQDAARSPAERLHLLRQAAAAHVAYIKKAAAGKACDRHLWGLRKCMQAGDGPTPAIFQDPVFWRTSTWHVSTSNLSNDLFDGWGWGEVVPDGLGVAYSTNSDVLTFNVTSCKGWAADFVAEVEQALRDMVATCQQGASRV